MIPYINVIGKNNINCNCDLVILDGGKPILLSLVDLAIITKKVCSDLIADDRGTSLYLKDRDNMQFDKYLYKHDERFRYKSERAEDLTHTIIYNSNINDYIIDWNNEGIVKIITKWLRNKKYLPITENILEKVLEYMNEENEKYTYSKSYVYTECSVYTNNPMFTGLKCYKFNKSIFDMYLKKITISDNNIDDGFNWDEIETIEDYIFTFLQPIKEKLKENISILYDKNTVSQEMFKGKRQPYDGQIPIIQSGIEVLKRDKFIYIAAEQGFGKSTVCPKILISYFKGINNIDNITFITAPAITLSQWKDELKECIGEKIDIITIKKTDEFIKWYNKTNMKVNKPTFILCGKETFKLQYKLVKGVNIKTQKIKVKEVDEWYANKYSSSNMPDYAYTYKEKTMTLVMCPKCGKPLKNEFRRKKEDIYFNEKDFTGSPKKTNYKCPHCNEILWQASYDKTKKTSVIDFIKRKNIKFDCVVVDEMQESNNSGSIIGNATKTLIRNHGKKIVLLSGTPSNGYASNLYNVLLALIPNTLIKNNVLDEKEFIKQYGTLEAITRKNDDHRIYYSRGRAEIKDSDFKEIEGVNPIVFTKFLSQNFIVADLNDLGKELPPFNEYYISIKQSFDMECNERKLFDDIKKVNAFNSKMYLDSIIKHYINNPFSWDSIHVECGDKAEDIQPYNLDNNVDLLAKEKELIDIIGKEYKENRKCWIYVDFNNGGEYMSGESIANRLERILKEKGYKVFQLKPSVKTYDRKDIIDKNKDKYDIFISNRKLVKVGLNLQFCPTYINYMPSYQVLDVDQANRRGMRANSILENRVYHLYYENSCENEIIKRYQRKKAESNAILGKFNVQIENEDEIRTSSKLSSKINNSIG